MPNIQVEAKLSKDELLKAVGQLSQPELENFVSQIIVLRAQRQAHSLPKVEADLLMNINQGLAPKVQEQYDELIAKRRAESLTPKEYDELLSISDQIENMEARRMEYLAELARLRKVSLHDLMESLGILTSTDA